MSSASDAGCSSELGPGGNGELGPDEDAGHGRERCEVRLREEGVSAPAPASARTEGGRDGEARREAASAEMAAVRSSVSAEPSMEASGVPVAELKRETVTS